MAISREDAVLSLVNTEFENLSGFSKEELEGKKTWTDFIRADDLSDVKESYKQWGVGSELPPRNFECQFINQDGQFRDIVLTVDLIPEADLFVSSILDITDRKQATIKIQQVYEQERDLRQQLEEEIRKRTEFTRALVHELRTPITPVLAATELLLEEVKDDRTLKLAQSINRSASNLNRRIDELIDLIRGETNMLQINPGPLDVIVLLRDIGAEVMPLATRSGHSLTIDMPRSNPIISADRDRVRQIVQNLMNNALKFTSEGDQIVVRAREEGDKLVIEVQDTGPGINKADRERIFNP